MTTARLILLVTCVILGGCEPAREAQWAEGESARVTRVLDGDTLGLENGQIVKLASIEAPSNAYRDTPAMPFSSEAKTILETLALGRVAELYYPGMTRDRYDRALAQVYITTETGKKIWLNEALVLRGAAWVRLFPDTSAGSEPLWIAETAARKARTGLWAESSPETDVSGATETDGRFVILKAIIEDAQIENDDCEHQLRGMKLTLVYQVPHNGACSRPPLNMMEVRGWLRGTRLYVNTTDAIRPIMKSKTEDQE